MSDRNMLTNERSLLRRIVEAYDKGIIQSGTGEGYVDLIDISREFLRETHAPEPTAVLVPHAYTCTECFTDAGQLHRPGCRFIEIDARRAENREVTRER